MANRTRDEGREAGWRQVVARFEKSGLSVREFCRREAVPESGFYFWRRTLREREVELAAFPAPASRPAAPAFVPLPVERRDVALPPAEVAIELGSGLTLRCPESVSVERIAALVRALQPTPQREEPRV